mmetsp:Transcript_9383/g.15690  ORF Transcript_9383/g.15690 Transcript_9383/m.15690 type:complete len:408 (-) Transcript_9383:702-1925(-)
MSSSRRVLAGTAGPFLYRFTESRSVCTTTRARSSPTRDTFTSMYTSSGTKSWMPSAFFFLRIFMRLFTSSGSTPQDTTALMPHDTLMGVKYSSRSSCSRSLLPNVPASSSCSRPRPSSSSGSFSCSSSAFITLVMSICAVLALPRCVLALLLEPLPLTLPISGLHQGSITWKSLGFFSSDTPSTMSKAKSSCAPSSSRGKFICVFPSALSASDRKRALTCTSASACSWVSTPSIVMYRYAFSTSEQITQAGTSVAFSCAPNDSLLPFRRSAGVFVLLLPVSPRLRACSARREPGVCMVISRSACASTRELKGAGGASSCSLAASVTAATRTSLSFPKESFFLGLGFDLLARSFLTLFTCPPLPLPCPSSTPARSPVLRAKASGSSEGEFPALLAASRSRRSRDRFWS